jgi:hypothetical protein
VCAEATESGGSEQEVREGSLGVKYGMVQYMTGTISRIVNNEL